MANFNVALNTNNFKPYTFEELAKPMMLLLTQWEKERDRADKIIDLYGNLNLPSGSRASLDYNNILELQKDAMESFYNGTYRGALPKMLKAFDLLKGTMSKLKSAADLYLKDINALTAQLINDPSTIVVKTPDIDDYYLSNTKPKIGVISGKNIAAEVAAGVKGILDNIKQNISFKSTSIDGLLESIKLGKVTPLQLMDLAQNPSANGLDSNEADDVKAVNYVLQNYFNSIRDRNSYNTMDSNNQSKFNSWIMQGALMGTPATETTIVNNPNFISPELKYRKERDAIEDERAELAALKQTWKPETTNTITDKLVVDALGNPPSAGDFDSDGNAKDPSRRWRERTVTKKTITYKLYNSDGSPALDANGKPITRTVETDASVGTGTSSDTETGESAAEVAGKQLNIQGATALERVKSLIEQED